MEYSRKQLKQVEKNAEKGIFPKDYNLWYAYIEWKQNKIYSKLFIMLMISVAIYAIPEVLFS